MPGAFVGHLVRRLGHSGNKIEKRVEQARRDFAEAVRIRQLRVVLERASNIHDNHECAES